MSTGPMHAGLNLIAADTADITRFLAFFCLSVAYKTPYAYSDPDPIAIEQEEMVNYASALQNYYNTNPSYVYKASEAPVDFTSRDLLTRYTTMLGDPAEIVAADPTTYMRDKLESGNLPPVWTASSTVKTDADVKALENSWGLTDEQVNEMLQNGTLETYIKNYQELENQRRLQIQNYTAMNISNMMHYGPAYTYFK